jgi:hypothetical protein
MYHANPVPIECFENFGDQELLSQRQAMSQSEATECGVPLSRYTSFGLHLPLLRGSTEYRKYPAMYL